MDKLPKRVSSTKDGFEAPVFFEALDIPDYPDTVDLGYRKKNEKKK